MPYIPRRPSNISIRPSKRRPRKKVVIIAILLGLLALGIWFVLSDKAVAPDPSAQLIQELEGPQPLTTGEPTPEPTDLQPVIDSWIAKQSATYSIVVYDARANKVIGSTQPDKVFFAASLYKIYVAYLALLDFQTGAQDPNEIITGGFSRKICVDKMIRESHSPCGEAMMADMGQKTLEARVKSMGINHTTFAGIQTSAHDSALILQYILDKRDLNSENTAFLRDAMLTQDAKYKRGLATGAPDAKWETKVGWNETYNYHDIGIMTMPDKREYIVAILSQGNGSSVPIANFAKTIYSALSQ
ncbi:serine hydrolase [Candidatus Saccharibacteria bacterium]|nr:serine hydrolase [Candidatus Saccharibacteria bacterium]